MEPPIIVMQSFILSCNLIVSTYLAIGLFYIQSNFQVATETTTIIEALNKFVTHRISALPIVVRSTMFYKIANCKNSSNGQKYVLTNFSVTFDIVLQIARKNFVVMHLRSNIQDMKCCLIDDFNIDDV